MIAVKQDIPPPDSENDCCAEMAPFMQIAEDLRTLAADIFSGRISTDQLPPPDFAEGIIYSLPQILGPIDIPHFDFDDDASSGTTKR